MADAGHREDDLEQENLQLIEERATLIERCRNLERRLATHTVDVRDAFREGARPATDQERQER